MPAEPLSPASLLNTYRINQEQAEERTRKEHNRAGYAGLSVQHLNCIEAEMRGGECPCGCGQMWEEVEVENDYAIFTYYQPPKRGCAFPSCPRCRARGWLRSLWDCSTAGAPLECSCGWREKAAERVAEPSESLD